jgi:short-subunit dehydrogenase
MSEKILKNKTVLISGASRLQGIVAAVARKSAEKELKLCLILNCSI